MEASQTQRSRGQDAPQQPLSSPHTVSMDPAPSGVAASVSTISSAPPLNSDQETSSTHPYSIIDCISGTFASILNIPSNILGFFNNLVSYCLSFFYSETNVTISPSSLSTPSTQISEIHLQNTPPLPQLTGTEGQTTTETTTSAVPSSTPRIAELERSQQAPSARPALSISTQMITAFLATRFEGTQEEQENARLSSFNTLPNDVKECVHCIIRSTIDWLEIGIHPQLPESIAEIENTIKQQPLLVELLLRIWVSNRNGVLAIPDSLTSSSTASYEDMLETAIAFVRTTQLETLVQGEEPPLAKIDQLPFHIKELIYLSSLFLILVKKIEETGLNPFEEEDLMKMNLAVLIQYEIASFNPQQINAKLKQIIETKAEDIKLVVANWLAQKNIGLESAVYQVINFPSESDDEDQKQIFFGFFNALPQEIKDILEISLMEQKNISFSNYNQTEILTTLEDEKTDTSFGIVKGTLHAWLVQRQTCNLDRTAPSLATPVTEEEMIEAARAFVNTSYSRPTLKQRQIDVLEAFYLLPQPLKELVHSLIIMDSLTTKFEESSTSDDLDWDTFDALLLLNKYSDLDKSMKLQWLEAQVAKWSSNGRLFKVIGYWHIKQQWTNTMATN
jgi:hypothetical protein